MQISKKTIEESIRLIMGKYSLLTHNKGIDELEEYIVTFTDILSKEEIMKLLLNIYETLSKEYEEEIIGEVMNRIHGFCTPKNEIKWK